ncbi:hypothetical protein, partial [Moorena sp. SIO2C4]|uniref:hypothetical protein n=1 Tax=Moorena sp. SIO2C4 TaxID=2607824 RepID=UPI00257F914D
ESGIGNREQMTGNRRKILYSSLLNRSDAAPTCGGFPHSRFASRQRYNNKFNPNDSWLLAGSSFNLPTAEFYGTRIFPLPTADP